MGLCFEPCPRFFFLATVLSKLGSPGLFWCELSAGPNEFLCMSLSLNVHEGDLAQNVCSHTNGAVAPAVVARRPVSATSSKVRHLSTLRL